MENHLTAIKYYKSLFNKGVYKTIYKQFVKIYSVTMSSNVVGWVYKVLYRFIDNVINKNN
jgi:hypothetical protein